VLAALGFFARFLHPLLAQAILVCGSLFAAYAVANGDRESWRPDLTNASELASLVRLGVAVFVAGAWPLLVVSFCSAPLSIRVSAAAVGPDPGASLAVVRADELEKRGFEFGDFGGDGRTLAPPPKTGVAAEAEAREYAEFEAAYVREEMLYADHEEEGGDEPVSAAPATSTAGAAFVDPAAAATTPGDARPSRAGSTPPTAAVETQAAAVAAGSSLVLILALVWRLAYTPLALVVALTTNSVVHTFNPGDGVSLARRMGRPLAAALLVYAAVLAVRFLVGQVLDTGTTAGGVAVALVDAYACLAVGCALGCAASTAGVESAA
jgi:hypothetical protein